MSLGKVCAISFVTALSACSSEPPAGPPKVKANAENYSSVAKEDSSGLGDVFGTMGKSGSASSIRSAKKSQLMQEIAMLENDLESAMGNMNKLQTQITRDVLTKGLPSANSPTVQGSLITAGGDLLTAGLLAGLAGGGSLPSTGDSKPSTGSGGKYSGLEAPLSAGVGALGQAVSVGITKDENGKTIRKITGSIEEQAAQYAVEVRNLQAQIDQKNAEINQLIMLGTR